MASHRRHCAHVRQITLALELSVELADGAARRPYHFPKLLPCICVIAEICGCLSAFSNLGELGAPPKRRIFNLAVSMLLLELLRLSLREARFPSVASGRLCDLCGERFPSFLQLTTDR